MQAMIVEGDGDMVGDAAGYVAGDAASGAADALPTASSGHTMKPSTYCGKRIITH